MREMDNEQLAILNNIPHMAWLKDQDGRYIAVNEKFRSNYDLPEEKILGKTDYEFCPRELADKYTENDRLVFQSRKQQYFIEESQDDAGLTKWSETFKTPIFDSQNIIVGVTGISRDITQRVEEEKREKKYQDQLVFLSETALEFMSQSFQQDIFEYIGRKLKELIGEAVVIVSRFSEPESKLHVRSVDGVEGLLDKVIKLLGKKPLEFEIPVDEASLQLIFNSSNKLTRFDRGLYESSAGNISKTVAAALEKLINCKNVYGIAFERGGHLFGAATIMMKGDRQIGNPRVIEAFIFQCAIALHRQQLETELRAAILKAEESDKLKTAFLANMSHEIRTPMNGILGLTNLLNSPDLGKEEHQNYVNLILSSGNVLLSLLDGILDISRIEANQVILNKETFNLNTLIRDLHDYYLSELELTNKKDVRLLISIPPADEKVNIYTDQVKLRQILVNLISNAIKFTEKGQIEFGYRIRNEKLLEFHVLDTGIGIEEDKQEVIFERFVQGDSSPTRQYGGSGLGLAICKGFVDLFEGEIWLESEPENGTSFYFSIPLEQIEPGIVHPEEGSDRLSQKNWEGRTILIVEDDYVNFKLLEGILKKTRATILHAMNGLEAVTLCKDELGIDLVLMDLQLPELNGFEAIRQIRAFQPELPIVVQTAYAMNEEKYTAQQAGCNGFITKPIHLQRFLEEVEKYM